MTIVRVSNLELLCIVLNKLTISQTLMNKLASLGLKVKVQYKSMTLSGCYCVCYINSTRELLESDIKDIENLFNKELGLNK